MASKVSGLVIVIGMSGVVVTQERAPVVAVIDIFGVGCDCVMRGRYLYNSR